jgi:Ni,Fe-hydrogenase III small subunit
MAKLLRQKSKVLVAFGSCAYEGCIPALSNLTSKRSRPWTPSSDNPSSTTIPDGCCRKRVTEVPEGDADAPGVLQHGQTLDQVVDVDYYMPGCPPEPHQIWAVLQVVVAALTGRRSCRPPAHRRRGQVAVCEECPLEKHEKPSPASTALRINPGTFALPAGAGHYVHGTGHPQRLWGALPAGGHGLPRLLRPAARRGGPGRQDADGHRLVLDVGEALAMMKHRPGSQLDGGHHRRPGRHLLSLQYGPFDCCVGHQTNGSEKGEAL